MTIFSPVGGGFITVRGCAPFNTETFGRGFQRGMAGTYWKGSNAFSMCDYDNCNGAIRNNRAAGGVLIAAAALVAMLSL